MVVEWDHYNGDNGNNISDKGIVSLFYEILTTDTTIMLTCDLRSTEIAIPSNRWWVRANCILGDFS